MVAMFSPNEMPVKVLNRKEAPFARAVTVDLLRSFVANLACAVIFAALASAELIFVHNCDLQLDAQ